MKLLTGPFQTVGIEVAVGEAVLEFIAGPHQQGAFTRLMVLHKHLPGPPELVAILLIVAERQRLKKFVLAVIVLDLLRPVLGVIEPDDLFGVTGMLIGGR